jgi:hydroxymethylbilane synthase
MYDAIIMAHAGLIRAGLDSHITELLNPELFVPAPGQGALAIQTRSDDDDSIALVRLIDQSETHRCIDIERLLLEKLGAGCSTPVGGYARIEDNRVYLIAVVLDMAGKTRLRVTHDIGQDEDNGSLVSHVVDRLLKQGARELIAGDR